MRIFAAALSALAAVALIPDPAVAADAKKSVPYYASISATRARMRTGPARTYPASWLYQRQDLPIKVVAILRNGARSPTPTGPKAGCRPTC